MAFELFPLLAFATGIFLLVLGGVLLSGFLPISAMPDGWWTASRKILVGLDILLLMLLIAAVFRLASGALGWPVAVVAGGLAALAAPPVFQIFPDGFKNSAKGLAAIAPVLAAHLAVIIAVMS